MSQVVIFLGPPGAGKGTQAVRVARELELEKISTGDILRDHMARGTELGARVKPIYDAGQLVPDDIMIAMIREKLATQGEVRAIFDGFPRNLSQARALDLLLEELSCPVNAVLLLDVPEDLLVQRMLERSRIEGRSDDTPETIRRRQDVYRESTSPLIDYYAGRGNLRRIDGTGTPDEVYSLIRAALA